MNRERSNGQNTVWKNSQELKFHFWYANWKYYWLQLNNGGNEQTLDMVRLENIPFMSVFFAFLEIKYFPIF